jgi:hypothetical protein
MPPAGRISLGSERPIAQVPFGALADAGSTSGHVLGAPMATGATPRAAGIDDEA